MADMLAWSASAAPLEEKETRCPVCWRLWREDASGEVEYYAPLYDPTREPRQSVCGNCFRPQTHPL